MRVQLVAELSIARYMIAMAVRMGDDKLQRRMAMVVLPLLNERSDSVTNRHWMTGCRLSARVEQQSFLRAEKQIQKRCFEIRALALTQDERVRIELERLKRRVRTGRAVGRAMNPRKGLNGAGHLFCLSC